MKKRIVFIAIILVVLLGGSKIMADKNLQISQRNASNTGWDNYYPVTKGENVIMDDGDTVERRTAKIENSNVFADKKKYSKRNVTNIVGDSISQGYNSTDFVENSYVGLLRKSLMAHCQSNNYGYVQPSTYYERQTYRDLFFTETTWVKSTTSDNVGFTSYTTSTANAEIKFTFNKSINFKEIDLKFIKGASSGSIDIYVNGVLASSQNLNNAITVDHTISLYNSNKINQLKEIKIVNKSGTNSFTGIWFYNDRTQHVLNNYSLSGAKLGDTSQKIANEVMNAETVIFALGHNPTYAEGEDITLQYFKNAYDTYKPKVYVLDFLWYANRENTRTKLKEFADYCNGVFVDFITPVDVDSNDLISSGFLTDVSHPSDNGHKIIADKLIYTMGILKKEEVKNYSLPSMYVQLDDGKGVNISGELYVNSGNISKLYLRKSTDGMVYLFADSEANSVSTAINMNGKNIITNGYHSTIKLDGNLYIDNLESVYKQSTFNYDVSFLINPKKVETSVINPLGQKVFWLMGKIDDADVKSTLFKDAIIRVECVQTSGTTLTGLYLEKTASGFDLYENATGGSSLNSAITAINGRQNYWDSTWATQKIVGRIFIQNVESLNSITVGTRVKLKKALVSVFTEEVELSKLLYQLL